jgi:uncharacterized cupin superfamily protein
MPLPRLATEAHTLDESAPPYIDQGHWRVRNLFRGKTGGLRALGAHLSWLEAGKSAHAPHSHPGEELCIVFDGELELELPEEGVHARIERGQAGFFSANIVHGLASVGPEHARYLIVRWLADPPEGLPTPLDRAIVDVSGTMLDTATGYLQRLRCDVMSGELGTSAVARTDTLLVALAGELEAGGQRTRPIGCIYLRPGEEYEAAGTSFITISLDPYPAGPARRLANSTRWYSRTSPLRRPMTVRS